MRERVHTDQLQEAVEKALSRFYGRETRIATIQRRHSRYSSSFHIENLELKLTDGKALNLVFKDSSPDSLLESAREVRPLFLYDPLREMEVYRVILNPARLGTPVFYGAAVSPEAKRYWLFLERVRGPLLWQAGDIECWCQAAAWLARLHNEFARSGTSDRQPLPALLLRYDRRLLTLWWTRAENFLSLSTPRGTAEQRTLRCFNRLTGRHDRVVDRLLALADTFVHGEFYPSNIILRRQGAGLRTCPIDWEVAGIGPGLIDLAALTSGAWGAEQRRKMVSAYRDAVDPNHGWPPSLPELMEAVQYCQLHLAVQWLGWATDWSPPRTHAHNWLREAVRLSTVLGI